ncbi:hypothetical protein TNCV_1542521 [Trichonephila clavipes]|nr:hypothetical protein TNCV_1542521 [Trichonephila clavipes]
MKHNSNSGVQQPLRARAYCVHSSIRYHEVHEQMSRSDGQSKVRPQVLKSPRKLDTHLSNHCSRDEKWSRPLPSPGIEPGPVVWNRDTLTLDHRAFLNHNLRIISLAL